MSVAKFLACVGHTGLLHVAETTFWACRDYQRHDSFSGNVFRVVFPTLFRVSKRLSTQICLLNRAIVCKGSLSVVGIIVGALVPRSSIVDDIESSSSKEDGLTFW